MFKKIILSFKSIKNILTFVLDYFGFIRNDITYKLRNNTKLIARGNSTDASEIIIINSDLEYPKKYFPYNYNPIIIDAGANIGAFSVYIIKELIKNKPMVYSIEPSLNNFKYLNKNIKLNNFESAVSTNNVGFYNKNGTGYIDLKKEYDSYCATDRNNFSDSEKVNLVTIEDFCTENKISRIDLLKMDIEGGEYCVFYNSINFIKEHIKKVFIEVHYLDEENNISNFIKFIENNDFKVIDIIMGRTLVLENNKII